MLQYPLALAQFKSSRERDNSGMFCFVFPPVPLTEATPRSFSVSFRLIQHVVYAHVVTCQFPGPECSEHESMS